MREEGIVGVVEEFEVEIDEKIIRNSEFYKQEVKKLTDKFEDKLSTIVDMEFEKIKQSQENSKVAELEQKISELTNYVNSKQAEIDHEIKTREILENLLSTIGTKTPINYRQQTQLIDQRKHQFENPKHSPPYPDPKYRLRNPLSSLPSTKTPP